MLNLPSLKNGVAYFLSCSHPHQSHLELSPPRRWQIQLTLKPWPLSKIVVRKRSVYSAVHPSKLRFDKQVLYAWFEMFQLEFSTPLSQQNSEKTFFFCTCTTFPMLGVSPLGVLCLLDLSGASSPTASPTGRDPACTANRARSTTTPACCRSQSPSLDRSLLTSISTDGPFTI